MALRQIIVRQLSTARIILAGVIVTDDELQNEILCTLNAIEEERHLG